MCKFFDSTGKVYDSALSENFVISQCSHFNLEISNAFARVLHDPGVLLLSRVQHLDVVQTSQVREPPGILFEVRGHGEQRVFQLAAGLGSVTPAEILYHKDGSSWWTNFYVQHSSLSWTWRN